MRRRDLFITTPLRSLIPPYTTQSTLSLILGIAMSNHQRNISTLLPLEHFEVDLTQVRKVLVSC
jgi:hypothetical protein